MKRDERTAEFIRLLAELDRLNPKRAREFVAEMKRATKKRRAA